MQVEVVLTLSVNEMRINADFDKELDGGHREDFRDPSVLSLADDDLRSGSLTIASEPARPGQFWLTFDGDKIGEWVCQGGECGTSEKAWERQASGAHA